MAVLGCGASGAGAARLAAREGAAVTVFDSGPPEKLEAAAAALRSAGHGVVLGDAALAAQADRFDLVVISPGIDASWPLAAQFTAAGVPLVGETEFASRFCGADIVAITGTNGKTTTTELVRDLLSAAGQACAAAGNHGRPLSEVVCDAEPLAAVALEVSSFQLETIDTFRPAIAVWTNFAPDHLDRYPDLAAYREAKLRVFENQTADDWAVVNARDELPPLAAQTTTFSAVDGRADITYRDGEIVSGGEVWLELSTAHLRGLHNAENLMAALAVGKIRGCDPAAMAAAAAAYRPAPHRCELVREVAGVEFINDSKATNLHSLECALAGIDSPGGIVLIAGGKDKGLPFAELGRLVAERARAVVLIGEIREALARAWGGEAECRTAGSVAEAVRLAAALSAPGGTVLFSPGTSSFDMFSGYAERGEAFRTAVAEL